MLKKPLLLLLKIEDGMSLSDLAREMKVSCAYILRNVKYLESVNLVKTYRVDNMRKILLTKKGRKVKDMLIKCMKLM